MKNLIKKMTGGYTSSAKVVDGTLILSLPNALSPIVWRMDLGFVRASAMEIREEDDGTFMLILKTPKKDVNEIAPFSSKAKALNALMAVSNAMENAHGQIRSAAPAASGASGSAPANDAPREKKSVWGKIATGVAAVVLLFLFLSVIINLAPPPSQTFPTASGEGTEVPAGMNDAGVPLSAEDFLKKRRMGQ